MSLAAEHRSPTQTTTSHEPAPSGNGRGPAALSPQARAAISARARSEIGDLDYVRALRSWIATGATQTDIARALGLTQGAISRTLSRHSATAMPAAGFAGATPLEVCKRYAAGDLSRAEVVDQLARFPYTPTPEPSGWDDLVVDPPGAWSELATAQGLRLIDATIYRDVFLAQHPEYAEEYADEIAAESADDGGDGDGEGSRNAQSPQQPGAIDTRVPTAVQGEVQGEVQGKVQGEVQGEVQGGSQAPAGDGLSAAPRT